MRCRNTTIIMYTVYERWRRAEEIKLFVNILICELPVLSFITQVYFSRVRKNIYKCFVLSVPIVLHIQNIQWCFQHMICFDRFTVGILHTCRVLSGDGISVLNRSIAFFFKYWFSFRVSPVTADGAMGMIGLHLYQTWVLGCFSFIHGHHPTPFPKKPENLYSRSGKPEEPQI